MSKGKVYFFHWAKHYGDSCIRCGASNAWWAGPCHAPADYPGDPPDADYGDRLTLKEQTA